MTAPITIEELSQIEISSDGRLYLYLNTGNLSYEYVYRAGAGVYWDEGRKAFWFDMRNEREAAKWYIHVVKITESELGINIRLKKDTNWINFSIEERAKIQRIFI